MENNNEQAELEISDVQSQEAVEPQETTDDIFNKALKDKAGSPEDAIQTEEDQTTEQPEEGADTSEVETPYGEITLDEAKKLRFKDKKEFMSFLDKNPFLKDKFLMQSDYTRKTQQVAQERKKFEEDRIKFEQERLAQDQGWGKDKPAPDDLKVFQNLWTVFKHGSDALASRIQSFLSDVSLISEGKAPKGLLAGQSGESSDFQADSQVIRVKRELDQYRAEQERRESERNAKEAEREVSEARSQVDGWISAKEKSGVKVSQDELSAMARFSTMKNDNGERISLDEMHRLALAFLGKTEKEAIQKVFTKTKQKSNSTPQRPASRVPSNAKADASNLDDILQEGKELLAQG